MIAYDQAFSASEFHVPHAGLPCTVWHRAGLTHAMHDDASMPGWLTDDCGGFFVPIERDGDDGRHWHHITGASAADFHVADECPHVLRMKDDRPPAGQVLSLSDRSEDGYDIWGFDASGYDRNGYDSGGYDRNGYDADGYDDSGYDADGDPRPGNMDASDLDLADLWSGFPSNRWGSARKTDFRHHLRSLVRDPDEIDELMFCGNCDEPAWDEDLLQAQGGSISICESCWDDWTSCNSCDERYPAGDLTEALSGADICAGCRSSYYSYCTECDGYYHDDDTPDHDHDSSGTGCCESPQQEFAVRNDGDEPLANDTRIAVTLPAGTISAEGLTAISRYLRDQGHFDVSYDLGELGDEWQTRGGNFAKRLSRLAYQRYQAKITPDVLSQVGCIARDHSNAVSVTVEVSRDLNASAASWYYEDSCYWGSYYESRCALKTNGGLGLRSFSHGCVSGRAWVLPLRLDEAGKLVPTFNTLTPDAFVVFNGYGDLAGYAAPRIVAHMAGWTYRKVSFSADPVYVNSGGYLVAPESIAEQYTDGSLYLSVSQHSRLFDIETARELANA